MTKNIDNFKFFECKNWSLYYLWTASAHIKKDYDWVFYQNDDQKTIVYDLDKNKFKPLIRMWYHQFRNSFLTFWEKAQIAMYVIFVIFFITFYVLINNAINSINDFSKNLDLSLTNVKNVDFVMINSFSKWAVEKYNIEEYTWWQLNQIKNRNLELQNIQDNLNNK